MHQKNLPELLIKDGVRRWQACIYAGLKEIEQNYFTDHNFANAALENKHKGYTGFRVRRRENSTGLSVAVEWYKLKLICSDKKTVRSQPINKGSSEKALLRNIKRTAHDWEYELAVEYVAKLRPYLETLKSLGKISRYNYAAIKNNPVQKHVNIKISNTLLEGS